MKKNGLTIIELLVVISIIGILTTILLVVSPSAKQGFSLPRSVAKLVQDIRRVQEKAVATKNIGGSSPDGYGVYFDKNSAPDSYILFADKNDNQQWDSGTDALIEQVSLEEDINVNNLIVGAAPVNILNVVFTPPDPTVWINSATSVSSTVTLQLDVLPVESKSVFVNSSGLITAE